MITLGELLNGEAQMSAQAAALAVTGIATDSRIVKQGDVFFALAGSKADGSQFVAQARKAGAIAVVGVNLPSDASGIAVEVANPRRALAIAASRFYSRQPPTIAAVTGTSGKTSVASFTRQIWSMLGRSAASIGTVGLVSPSRSVDGSLTTPDPVALHRSLDQLAAEGVTHLALEASSHGLDQHRLDGVRVAVGGFTNLSRDHMDYHPSVEHYLTAKMRLFSDLIVPGGTAVIATDHEHSEAVISAAKAKKLNVMTVGRHGEALTLREAAIDGFGQTLVVGYAGKDFKLRLPLVGEFQIENALVAAGLAIATGEDAARVLMSLERLEGAQGRLENVGEKSGAPIFVDYAHKPDALAKALEALRPYAKRHLVVVFGAGGDRDPGKRLIMGEIAAQNADRVIVTDDNPRSENPSLIRAAILKGAPEAREIGDRAFAIREAIKELQKGDVLLVAGKGHETGQIVGTQTLPFSDHEAIASVLAEHGA